MRWWHWALIVLGVLVVTILIHVSGGSGGDAALGGAAVGALVGAGLTRQRRASELQARDEAAERDLAEAVVREHERRARADAEKAPEPAPSSDAWDDAERRPPP